MLHRNPRTPIPILGRALMPMLILLLGQEAQAKEEAVQPPAPSAETRSNTEYPAANTRETQGSTQTQSPAAQATTEHTAAPQTDSQANHTPQEAQPAPEETKAQEKAVTKEDPAPSPAKEKAEPSFVTQSEPQKEAVAAANEKQTTTSNTQEHTGPAVRPVQTTELNKDPSAAPTVEAKASHEAPGETAPATVEHASQTEHGNKDQASSATHGESSAAAHGEAGKAEHGPRAGGHEAKPEVPAEIMTMQATELFKYADKAYEDGRYDMALIAYRQLLGLKMPKPEIRKALLSFGRTLKKKGELTKAVAVYERLIKDFPAEQDTPEVFLELGRCQRALGAYKTAINRFYSVLNSTIKLTEDGAAKYRQLAKTAQFEIAETYFISGDYKEAMRFYSRLRLLDLNPSDRARAHFKAAYSQQLAGDHIGAITQLRSFIELNPEDENVPEARYLIAMSLRALDRTQDALFEALELLKTERTRTAQDPKRWAYWQRKTGNQIANEFYNQGDTNSALMIYLSLVELSSEASWRAPILYQIALCQERQGRKDKAIENYKSILDIAAAQKGDDPRKADFTELARMATWRLSQIEWVHKAEQRLNTLLPNPDAEGPQPTPTEKK